MCICIESQCLHRCTSAPRMTTERIHPITTTHTLSLIRSLSNSRFVARGVCIQGACEVASGRPWSVPKVRGYNNWASLDLPKPPLTP